MRGRERFPCGCFGFLAIRAAFYGLFMFFIIGCGEADLAGGNEYTQKLAASSEDFLRFSARNIFEGGFGTVVLNITDADRVASGAVNIYDEQGNSVSRSAIPPGAPYMEIGLSSIGNYSITASVLYEDGSTAGRTVTAAVVGEPVAESERAASILGLWNVSGDIKLAEAAGARWTRRMWPLKDYKEGPDGAPLPMELNKKPMDPGFNWIGTLAWGLPSYLTGVEPEKGALYPPKDWDKLRLLIERFANDLPEFPPYFEVYNEPEAHWKGNEEELARFISVIAGAIKTVHPDTAVLAPTLYEIDLDRLERLVGLGLLNGIDGLSIHAYVNGTPPEAEFMERVQGLKAYLASIGRGGMPVFLTEFGWTTGKGTWQSPVDELTQARYLSRSLMLLSTEDVEAAVYFCLLYLTNNAGEAGFSILNQDQSPKPAFAAYANAARRLSGVTGKGRWLRVPPSGNIALFKKGSATEAVAWDTGEGSSLFAGLEPRSAVDMMGRPASQGFGGFSLNGSPLFLTLGDASMFDAGVLSPISLRKGESALVPVADILGEGFSIRDGVLDVHPDAPAGRYIIMGVASDGWQVLPLEVR